MGTPLGPKYIPYTYMDPLGRLQGLGRAQGVQSSAVPPRRRHLSKPIGPWWSSCHGDYILMGNIRTLIWRSMQIPRS